MNNAFLGNLGKFAYLDKKLLHEWRKWRHLKPFIKRNQGRETTRENTVAFFSVPRSGSTWLAEILHEMPQSCVMCEPLITVPEILDLSTSQRATFVRYPEIVKEGFYFLQSIPEGAIWPEAAMVMERLIKGQVPSVLLYELDKIDTLRSKRYFIFHFNHASLMMSWLLNKFDMTAFALVRHPCAVVASQLTWPQLNSIRQSRPGHFPDFRFNDIYVEHADYLKTLRSKEQLLAFLWALQVKEVFYHPAKGSRWLPIAYESLVTDFEREVYRIFDWLGKPVPESVWTRRAIPSASTYAASVPLLGTAKQLSKWKADLTSRQVGEIMEVVAHMGVDFYDREDILPDYRKLYGLP